MAEVMSQELDQQRTHPKAACLDASYEQELRRLLRVDLLILDDLALVPNSQEPHPIGFAPAACPELRARSVAAERKTDQADCK
jgi:hypothetical protein